MKYDLLTKLYLIIGMIFIIGAFAVLPTTHNPWAAGLTFVVGACFNRMAMAHHWKQVVRMMAIKNIVV
jgi:hypothetical protein